MVKYSLLCFALLFSFIVKGQNLISNHSFEDTLLRMTPLFLPAEWYTPTKASPDLITPLHKGTSWEAPSNYFGYQNAFSGQAYMGLIIYRLYTPTRDERRDYIQVKLNHALKRDSTYCLRFYLSLSDSSQFASRNQLGAYFATTAISSNNNLYLPYTPQIRVSPTEYFTEKNKWVRFKFEYLASGGEEYLTIGNFNDTTFLDTLFVGGGNKVPHQTTYYYIDDVYLGHCDSLPEDSAVGILENDLENQITIYPNPVKEQLNISYQGNKRLEVRLIDLHGRELLFVHPSTHSTVLSAGPLRMTKEYKFSVAHLPRGIYFIEIIAGEQRISRKILKQ